MPTDIQIIAIHKKYAPNEEVFQAVYTHCTIVWEIVQQLLPGLQHNIDRELVKTGCLLHDIGVYQLYRADGSLKEKAYVMHGVLGDKTLRQEGYSEQLCRFASCHTGVGLTRQDIVEQNLPLPSGDYTADTVEERIVMYADKYHSKTTPPLFNTANWYLNYIKRFGEDKQQKFQSMLEQFGEPDVEVLAQKYHQEIRE